MIATTTKAVAPIRATIRLAVSAFMVPAYRSPEFVVGATGSNLREQ
jgi:hypothetical protein